MGGASSTSKASVLNPFPIDSKQSNDLDLLSYVAARILSTPDIYDINNLARPGVCGDYAVFLKKDLEKKLLNFIADVDGVPTDVVYQNPNKAIDKIEVRKKICSDMVDALLRAIATIVACLASIQVASPSGSRDAAIAPVPKQSGGGTVEVRRWLTNNGYISQADAAKPIGDDSKIEFKGHKPLPSNYTFQLMIYRTTGTVTYGRISTEIFPGSVNPSIRSGELNIHFLDPITLAIPGQNISVLPLEITDQKELKMISGFLFGSVFKSFKDSTLPLDLSVDFLHKLFKQPYEPFVIESREDSIYSSRIFKQLAETRNPQILHQAVGGWLSRTIPGYVASPYQQQLPQPLYGQQQPPYGQPQPLYGQQQPLYGQQLYGQPQFQKPVTGLINPLYSGTIAFRPTTTTSDMSYVIPLEATTKIKDEFKRYREIIPKESSPAAVRAKTLAGLVNPDRTIQTNICVDPFWNSAKMSEIYPWATFQFLSVENWNTLADSKKVTFTPEWKTFVDGLASVYSVPGMPILERQTGAYALDQMRFAKVGDVIVGNATKTCKDNRVSKVKFKEVQDGLATFQNLYAQHNAKMWALLGDLIYIIEDPETKVKMVRLHPNVVRSSKKESSKAYVGRKAAEACRAIGEFYLSVERSYVDRIKTLQVV